MHCCCICNCMRFAWNGGCNSLIVSPHSALPRTHACSSWPAG
jgi:hypothetical protein